MATNILQYREGTASVNKKLPLNMQNYTSLQEPTNISGRQESLSITEYQEKISMVASRSILLFPLFCIYLQSAPSGPFASVTSKVFCFLIFQQKTMSITQLTGINRADHSESRQDGFMVFGKPSVISVKQLK